MKTLEYNKQDMYFFDSPYTIRERLEQHQFLVFVLSQVPKNRHLLRIFQNIEGAELLSGDEVSYAPQDKALGSDTHLQLINQRNNTDAIKPIYGAEHLARKGTNSWGA